MPRRMARVSAPPSDTDAAAKIGLVLADGHPLVLRGMQHVFEGESDLDVLARCSSAVETIKAVVDARPDVLVLDFHLPGQGAMTVLRELAERAQPTRVVLLARSIGEREMLEAVRLGVKGLVLTEMAALRLVQCIRQVARGQLWIENRLFAGVVNRMVRHETRLRDLRQRLTPRELEILQLVAEGLRNKDITARLGITEGTVKIHLHNIYGKLGTNDRVQLVLRARDERIA